MSVPKKSQINPKKIWPLEVCSAEEAYFNKVNHRISLFSMSVCYSIALIKVRLICLHLHTSWFDEHDKICDVLSVLKLSFLNFYSSFMALLVLSSFFSVSPQYDQFIKLHFTSLYHLRLFKVFCLLRLRSTWVAFASPSKDSKSRILLLTQPSI